MPIDTLQPKVPRIRDIKKHIEEATQDVRRRAREQAEMEKELSSRMGMGMGMAVAGAGVPGMQFQAFQFEDDGQGADFSVLDLTDPDNYYARLMRIQAEMAAQGENAQAPAQQGAVQEGKDEKDGKGKNRPSVMKDDKKGLSGKEGKDEKDGPGEEDLEEGVPEKDGVQDLPDRSEDVNTRRVEKAKARHTNPKARALNAVNASKEDIGQRLEEKLVKGAVLENMVSKLQEAEARAQMHEAARAEGHRTGAHDAPGGHGEHGKRGKNEEAKIVPKNRWQEKENSVQKAEQAVTITDRQKAKTPEIAKDMHIAGKDSVVERLTSERSESGRESGRAEGSVKSLEKDASRGTVKQQDSMSRGRESARISVPGDTVHTAPAAEKAPEQTETKVTPVQEAAQKAAPVIQEIAKAEPAPAAPAQAETGKEPPAPAQPAQAVQRAVSAPAREHAAGRALQAAVVTAGAISRAPEQAKAAQPQQQPGKEMAPGGNRTPMEQAGAGRAEGQTAGFSRDLNSQMVRAKEMAEAKNAVRAAAIFTQTFGRPVALVAGDQKLRFTREADGKTYASINGEKVAPDKAAEFMRALGKANPVFAPANIMRMVSMASRDPFQLGERAAGAAKEAGAKETASKAKVRAAGTAVSR